MMKSKIFGFLGVAAMAISLTACGAKEEKYMPNITTTVSPQGTDIFKADDVNTFLDNYQIPDWYKDAKFGIFIHYGPYTVPAYGSEWYSRWMYQKGSKINKYHEKTYGPLAKTEGDDREPFGYKDFIPMLKCENFNASDWAKLFKEAGAEYVVPVAEHHDGFAMYKSAWNKWNAVDMGPKRDYLGELKTAIQAEGLHFGLSSHRCENAWFYEFGMKTPSDVRDTDCSLYGARLHQPEGKGMTPEYGKYEGSNETSRNEWLMHTYELIDQYQPELFWFDWTVGKYPFQPTFYKFMAYYYNNARDWNKEVVVNTKFGYSDQIQSFDIERGKSDSIRTYSWQTDTSVGTKSWSYCTDEVNKTPDHVIDDFVDIVSKNGNLLLNVGPTADGRITPEQTAVLKAIGGWMKVNGEAIYKTRPWVMAMEGENKGTSGYMTDNKKAHYTAQDIRFTTRDGFLYAIPLASTEGKITIKSISPAHIKDLKVNSVSMLGSDEKIVWKQTKKGLEVTFPSKLPTDFAHVFKIDLDGVAYGNPVFHKTANGLSINERVFNHNAKEAKMKFTSVVGKDKQEQVATAAPNSLAILTYSQPMPEEKTAYSMTACKKTYFKTTGKNIIKMTTPKKKKKH